MNKLIFGYDRVSVFALFIVSYEYSGHEVLINIKYWTYAWCIFVKIFIVKNFNKCSSKKKQTLYNITTLFTCRWNYYHETHFAIEKKYKCCYIHRRVLSYFNYYFVSISLKRAWCNKTRGLIRGISYHKIYLKREKIIV